MAAVKLGKYKGRDVLSSTVKVMNTGDGLSKAMAVDPVDLDFGETVFVLMETEVTEHGHKPIEDTKGLQLILKLRAGRATLVPDHAVETVIALLNEQQDRIDAAAGNIKLGDVRECAGCEASIAWDPVASAWRDGEGSASCGKTEDGFHAPAEGEPAEAQPGEPPE